MLKRKHKCIISHIVTETVVGNTDQDPAVFSQHRNNPKIISAYRSLKSRGTF